uniref:uncharacterized protein LOC120346374 n=1 Tax=Styela clava TaxID=7725 RepID=UPI00193AB78B|nr:uncharacterized protein LOC120346374 [Styela clava]
MSRNVSSFAPDKDEYRTLNNDSHPGEKPTKFSGHVWDQEYWTQCEVVLSILTLFSIYAFICILRYTTLKKSSPTRDTSGKQGRRLYIMLVLASGFTVLRLVSDHVVAFTSSFDDLYCFTTIAASTVMYALALSFVYIFLWMRQSIFYANPVLSKVLNKWVTFFSWSTLVVMLVCGAIMLVLYNLPAVNGWVYQVTEEGCKGILVEDDEIIAAVATALTVYFQISLLALFLYPLLSRKTQKYRSAGSQNNDATKGNGSVSNTDDNLTDGDASSSVRSGKFKVPATKKKNMDSLPLSENESVIDGRVADSGNFSKSSSHGDVSAPESTPKETTSKELSKVEIVSEKATERTKLSEKQKRPSMMFTPRFLKGNFFYRRNQTRNDTAVPQSPTAKRSRAKTLSTASTENESERTASVGSRSKRETKKRHRRTKRTQQGRRMMAYLRKSFYIMMICVVTDIACTVVQARVDVPELVYLVIYDLNIIINLVSIVMSFRDWDLILFPMCARSSSKRHSSSVMGSTRANVDPAASKRRLEALRSVNSKTCSSPALNSPRLPPKLDNSLSYDATEPKSQDVASGKQNYLDLNGKT